MENDISTAPPAPEFTVNQADLPLIIGVGIEEIRNWRNQHLIALSDFKKCGATIKWTPAAVDALRTALGIPAAAITPSVDGNAPGNPVQAPAALEKFLTVWKLTKNARIIMVHQPGKKPANEKDLYRLMVRDSSKFRPGQSVPCRHIKDDLWQYDRSIKAQP